MSTKVHPPTAVTFDLPGTVNICTRARRNIEVISFALMMANMFTKGLLPTVAISYFVGMVEIFMLLLPLIEVISFALLMVNIFTMVHLLIAVIYYTLYEENLYIHKRRNTDRTLFVQLMV